MSLRWNGFTQAGYSARRSESYANQFQVKVDEPETGIWRSRKAINQYTYDAPRQDAFLDLLGRNTRELFADPLRPVRSLPMAACRRRHGPSSWRGSLRTLAPAGSSSLLQRSAAAQTGPLVEFQQEPALKICLVLCLLVCPTGQAPSKAPIRPSLLTSPQGWAVTCLRSPPAGSLLGR